jgi:hypothetical protein
MEKEILVMKRLQHLQLQVQKLVKHNLTKEIKGYEFTNTFRVTRFTSTVNLFYYATI